MKEKSKQRVYKKNKKTRNQILWYKSHQRNKHLASPPCKIFWTILKLGKGLMQTYGQENRWQYTWLSLKKMYQEKKEEEDSASLTIVSMPQCKDSRKAQTEQRKTTRNSNVNLGTNSKTIKSRKQKWEEKIVWILQATNWEDCTRYDLNIATKR